MDGASDLIGPAKNCDIRVRQLPRTTDADRRARAHLPVIKLRARAIGNQMER
jgi:hypothetical protein